MNFLVISMLVTAIACAQPQTKKPSPGQESSESISSFLGSLISQKPKFTKEQALGDTLKKLLENLHYNKQSITDDLSKKAFKLYVERIDYSKIFLLEDDIKVLEKFRKQFDDQLQSGNLQTISFVNSLYSKRIPLVKNYVEELLKKPFSFSKDESFQTDPEKRNFVSSIDELKNRWRKMVKLDVLGQYLDLKQEQKDEMSNKKKTKKEKKAKTAETLVGLSQAELEKKSREKVWKRFKRFFKRQLDESKGQRQEKFYNSITKVFDPHSQYLIPDDKEDFDIEISGKLEGIGASLREDGSYIKVEKIIPGSASWKGKELKAEDIILAVAQEKGEAVSIVDMSIRDAVKLIRGPKGTKVILTVKKPDGSKKQITIIRDKVVIEASYVKHSVIENKKLGVKLGYINVPKFYRDFSNPNGRNSSTDVKKAIIELKKQKVEGIVLDLRNNGGGALDDATLMGGLFIKKGPIVQVKNHNGKIDIHRDTDGKVYFKKPLIVLINRFSASASEIVAGAMKDYGRALIVGTSEQTHGKGTVQAVVNVDAYVDAGARYYSPYGALKLTIQMFYRVNGSSTQFRGIKPDILLPGPLEYLESGERELEYAIPYNSVEKLDYPMWSEYKYPVGKLKALSEKRVQKSDRFKLINDSVSWYKERKDQTKRSLKISDMEKFRADAKVMADKFKDDDEDENSNVYKDVVVPLTSFKLRDDVEKEKRDDFVKGLRKDPVVNEVLHIFKDLKTNTSF